MEKKFKIIGINIDDLTYDEILEKIDNIIISGEQSYIVTINPEIVVNTIKDKHFYKVINGAKIKTADGVGIIWASEYLSKPIYKGKMRSLLQLFTSLFFLYINFCLKISLIHFFDFLGLVTEKIKISGAIYTRSNSPFASKYPILIKPSKIFRLMFEIQIY